MSVGDLLGLDEGGGMLAEARARWIIWAADDPRLRVVDDFEDLRDWLASVGRDDADAVLLALATLAATDGGDDVAAAGALAKCLLPGACVTANRLRHLVHKGHLRPSLSGPTGQRVDELVASQLWIEVRTFPWRRLTRVASNILVSTRLGVLYELGDNSRLWRTDKTWANTSLLDAVTRGDFHAEQVRTPNDDDAELSPPERLLRVLAWGCDHEVITASDRHLLLVVAEEAENVKTARTGRGRCGLVGNELSLRVAPRLGVSGATVRRRVARSMAALAAAVPREVARP